MFHHECVKTKRGVLNQQYSVKGGKMCPLTSHRLHQPTNLFVKLLLSSPGSCSKLVLFNFLQPQPSVIEVTLNISALK
jgi:hypothetical protein